ncbi:carboxylating nicotinate-nucleotide diphosphorylase [Candidatus Woesearchaeota archaeon]|nr:carboxylating nicotinate-nucleotide diphosphorylase [Candidatus Woesearchaeota archaeon]
MIRLILDDAKPLIELALREDIGKGDITSDSIIPKDKRIEADVIAKESGIVCGLDIIRLVYKTIDPNLVFKKKLKDGEKVRIGQKIINIKGNARSILTGERIVLNFLSALSGTATTTRKYVDKIKKYKTKILDTRKTIPGFRILQKYAVSIGGAVNHRMGLYDMVLIKDNHIETNGGIKSAVESVKKKISKNIKIEVETETLKQVEEALESGADWIMLDNMSVENMKKAVEMIKGKAKIEASGGITLDNLEDVAKVGVDYISIGALTHSFDKIDFSMVVKND